MSTQKPPKLSRDSRILVFIDKQERALPFIGRFVEFEGRRSGKSSNGQVWHKLTIKDIEGVIHHVWPGSCYEADEDIIQALSALTEIRDIPTIRKLILCHATRLRGRVKEPLRPVVDGKYFWEKGYPNENPQG